MTGIRAWSVVSMAIGLAGLAMSVLVSGSASAGSSAVDDKKGVCPTKWPYYYEVEPGTSVDRNKNGLTGLKIFF